MIKIVPINPRIQKTSRRGIAKNFLQIVLDSSRRKVQRNIKVAAERIKADTDNLNAMPNGIFARKYIAVPENIIIAKENRNNSFFIFRNMEK